MIVRTIDLRDMVEEQQFVRLCILVDEEDVGVNVRMDVLTLGGLLRKLRELPKQNVSNTNVQRIRAPSVNTIGTQLIVRDIHRAACLPITRFYYNLDDPDIHMLLWDIRTFMYSEDSNTTMMFLERIRKEKIN